MLRTHSELGTSRVLLEGSFKFQEPLLVSRLDSGFRQTRKGAGQVRHAGLEQAARHRAAIGRR